MMWSIRSSRGKPKWCGRLRRRSQANTRKTFAFDCNFILCLLECIIPLGFRSLTPRSRGKFSLWKIRTTMYLSISLMIPMHQASAGNSKTECKQSVKCLIFDYYANAITQGQDTQFPPAWLHPVLFTTLPSCLTCTDLFLRLVALFSRMPIFSVLFKVYDD